MFFTQKIMLSPRFTILVLRLWIYIEKKRSWYCQNIFNINLHSVYVVMCIVPIFWEKFMREFLFIMFCDRDLLLTWVNEVVDFQECRCNLSLLRNSVIYPKVNRHCFIREQPRRSQYVRFLLCQKQYACLGHDSKKTYVKSVTKESWFQFESKWFHWIPVSTNYEVVSIFYWK